MSGNRDLENGLSVKWPGGGVKRRTGLAGCVNVGRLFGRVERIATQGAGGPLTRLVKEPAE